MDADVTDSAGTATEPDSKSGREPSTGAPGPDDNDAEPAAPPSDSNTKRHWLRWVALGTSVAILATAGAGWWFYRKLDGNITTDTSAAAELHTYEKERPTPVALDAQNILLIGSDSRSGEETASTGGTTAVRSAPTPRSCCTSRRTGRARRPCPYPAT